VQGTNISHLWKKIALTSLKGHYRHKEIRRIWSMSERSGSGGSCGQDRSARWKGPKQHPLSASRALGTQPCPGDPAVPRGHLLTCTYLTGPKKAAGCMLPPTCGCVFTMELPQEQRRNETFQARYFQVCTKKTANDHERTGTHRITCVSTHDCKNPHGLNVPKPTPI